MEEERKFNYNEWKNENINYINGIGGNHMNSILNNPNQTTNLLAALKSLLNINNNNINDSVENKSNLIVTNSSSRSICVKIERISLNQIVVDQVLVPDGEESYWIDDDLSASIYTIHNGKEYCLYKVTGYDENRHFQVNDRILMSIIDYKELTYHFNEDNDDNEEKN